MRAGNLGSFRLLACPLLLAGIAFVFDGANRLVHYGPLSAAPLDEPAHLATARPQACWSWRVSSTYRCASTSRRSLRPWPSTWIAYPLYLGLLGNQNERPFTHSLATVAVVTGAAAASRRHRAVLAGTAIGLLLHFARDIVEGPPGVRMLWPLQQTAWTANYWWFLGMIVLFAGARVVLVSAGVPHTH